MYKHIIVPIDGSPASHRAAVQVAELFPAVSETRITLLLAVSTMKAEDTDFDPEVVRKHNTSLYQKAEAALERAAAMFALRGHKVATKVVEGDPISAAIANEVANSDADLIVMGSRGMGMDKSDMHYLGSVTEHVIRRVDVPVLVIPVHNLAKGREE